MGSLVIGLGELGNAVMCELLAREQSVNILTRAPVRSEMLPANVSNTYCVNLGVEPMPFGSLVGIDTVYYCAGTPYPSATLTQLPAMIHDELLPLISLLKEMKDASWAGRLIFASSGGTVYGPSMAKDYAWRELDRCQPTSAYGITKLNSELLLAAMTEHLDASVCIARISNIIGTWRNASRGVGFVQATVKAALTASTLKVFGTLDTVRDFIDLYDVARILVDIGNDLHCACTTINVSSGKPTSLREVVAVVEKQTGKDIDVRIVADRSSDVSYNVLSNRLLASRCAVELQMLGSSVDRLTDEFRPSQII